VQKPIVKRIILTLGIIITVVYILIFLDTLSLTKQVESLFRGEVTTASLSPNPTCLQIYTMSDNNSNTVDVNASVYTIFTIHNFKEGYMWVKFNCHAYDSQGNITGGEISTARWKIKRIDQQWKIIEVKQRL